jgi:hypothetical protein
MDGGRLALVRRVSASRPMAEVGGEPSNPLGPTRRQFGDAAAYGLTGGLTGTGYELPNFAARSRRPTFSTGAAPPLDGALRRSRTAPASRRSAFALAHATPRSPRGPPENRRDNFCRDIFFPIIGIRAMVNRERVRRRIAGPLVAAETTQKMEKTRFRLDRPTTP